MVPATADVRRCWGLRPLLYQAGSPRQDLHQALTPPSGTTDTAVQRRAAELEKCKFVYHDEQGLRECLVLKSGWTPQDAARKIAVYKATIGRAKALRRQLVERRRQAVRDSIAAAPDSARGAKARWDSAVAAGRT